MLIARQKMKHGTETQETADEENPLTSTNISISFFKRKKSGYRPSARIMETERSQKGSFGDEGEANQTESAIIYSPGANFDRNEYELRDTGRKLTDSGEVSFKALFINRIAKRAKEEAPEQDSVQDDCASLDYSY